MILVAGQRFADHTIVRRLGAGGMGEVYLAQHPRLARQVALKLLSADVSAEGNFRERFLLEADHASALWHPHIVGVLDRGEDDGQLWISMDFVDGEDVSTLIARRYPTGMPPDLVCEIITAIASALDYAHDQRLLHRDVKPANILVANLDIPGQRRILLTDFGIARNTADQTGLTKTNMMIGTVDYAGPQQLMGEDLDGRADQYSLGITAYELLTGRPPYRDSNPAVVISRHLSGESPAVAGSRPELAALDPVLATALAKDPEQRYARCGDFAQALAAQVAHDGAVPTRVAVTAAAANAVAAAQPTAQAPLAPGWYQDAAGQPSYWDGGSWQAAASPAADATGNRQMAALGVVAFLVVAVVVGLLAVVLTRNADSSTAEASDPAVTAALTPARMPTSAQRDGAPSPSAPMVPVPQQPASWRGVMVGTCDEGGTCGVKQRSAPYNAAPGLYPEPLTDGVVVTVVCQVAGDVRSNEGRGTSDIWYRLDSRVYVNSVYVDLRASGIPTC